MSAPYLSRWRALPTPTGWRVESEARMPAPEPCRFATYNEALARADELNHAEQRRNAGL